MLDKFSHLAAQRDKFAFYIFSVAFVVITAKLFHLQIIKYSYYKELSEKNRIRVLTVEAPRGTIYDRNNIPLVINKPSFTLSILPYEFVPSDTIIKKLSLLAGIEQSKFYEMLARGEKRGYKPVKIKHDIGFDVVSKIVEDNREYQGVICEVEAKREYPYGSVGAHIIGYIGEASVEDLRSEMGSYLVGGALVGKQGVERCFDRLLRGEPGAKFITVKANGEIVGPAKERKDIAPIKGCDIVLTIDIELQQYVEALFEPISCGAVIVMDPNTGEILSLVSKPSFDPNIMTSGIEDSVSKYLRAHPNYPFLNRATQGLYSPGSVFKIVTAGAAVNEGIVKDETTLEPCKGSIWYGDRYYRCWLSSGHGSVNLVDAIAVSCDIYFYQLGLKLGLASLCDYLKRCGFGSPTGFILKPESGGFVPDKDFYIKKYGKYGWGYGVVLNLAIGQGELLVTPLQVAQFISAVANGGTIYRPLVLRSIIPPFGPSRVVKPEVVAKLPFSEYAINTIIKGMSRAVNSGFGTGSEAKLDNIEVAGKTGTVQNPHGPPHGWFVAFAPRDNAELVVVVLAENWGSGSSVAYIAREIFKYYFEKVKSKRV